MKMRVVNVVEALILYRRSEMLSDKVNEIQKEIKYLEAQKAYNLSMISLLMAEANQADLEIEGLTRSGLLINEKIRDLEAELLDTL